MFPIRLASFLNRETAGETVEYCAHHANFAASKALAPATRTISNGFGSGEAYTRMDVTGTSPGSIRSGKSLQRPRLLTGSRYSGDKCRLDFEMSKVAEQR